MRKLHLLCIVSAGLFASVLGPGCSTPVLSAEARYGWMNVDGDLNLSSSSGGPVSSNNSVEALGLDQSDMAIGGRVDLDFGSPRLTVIGWQTDFEGAGQLDETITLGGVTINASSPVDSKLDLGTFEGLLTFDLFPGETFSLGLGLGVAVVTADLSIESQTTGLDAATDQVLPIPVLAATAGVDLFERVSVSVLASGMTASYDGDGGTYIDLDANVSVRLLGEVGGFAGHLTGGWRYTDIELQYDDDSEAIDIDTQFTGPYVGLAISF